MVPRIVLSESDAESLRVVAPTRPDDPHLVRDVPLVVGAAWLGVEPPLPEPTGRNPVHHQPWGR